MLSTWDDYPIHQAALPVLQPVDGDTTRYDRYFFHGYDVERGAIFVVALGIYPNRSIVDAAFVVSADGEQRSVFTSGRMTQDRATTVGPVTVEIVEPLRTLRVVVDAPEQGLRADLTFTARTAPVQEPRQTMMDRSRIIMDTCRFTQFGSWDGSVRSGDDDFEVRSWSGTRDRSWGIRPLSGATPAAPATDGAAGIWWTWAPIQFDDGCVHVALAEDADGTPTLRGATHVPLLDADTEPRHARDALMDIDWNGAARVAERARVTLRDRPGEDELQIMLEPVTKVFMRGAGYLNFDWAQGDWKGETEVGGEHLVHADLDPVTDFTLLHVQHVCVATASDGRVGRAVLEHLAIGPHAPSGFDDFMGPSS